MLIETWVLAIIMLLLGFIGFFSLLTALDLQKRLELEKEENAELKRYITVQKNKNIIGVANDFYNEESKE